MDEVKIKKTRKKKVSLVDSLISETVCATTSASKPVCGGEEIVVRHNGEVIASVNPNAIATFAAEHKLDANACEVCVSKGPHVNHNGYTFEKRGTL